MTLSYTRASGDNSLISNNYNLLNQWTQFLVNDSLIPASQYVLRVRGLTRAERIWQAIY